MPVRALSWPAVRGTADAQQGADPDEFDVDWLDADMMPADIVDVLRHLKFDNGKATLQVDRPARDYLIASVTAPPARRMTTSDLLERICFHECHCCAALVYNIPIISVSIDSADPHVRRGRYRPPPGIGL